jgi:hypothetical protein
VFVAFGRYAATTVLRREKAIFRRVASEMMVMWKVKADKVHKEEVA